MSKFLPILLLVLGVSACQKDQVPEQAQKQGNEAASKSADKGDAAVKSMYGKIKTDSLR